MTFVSQYPPAYNGDRVKATSQYSADYAEWIATDPSTSLTGSWFQNCWFASAVAPQRFHFDLGAAYRISQIFVVNMHHFGGATNAGVKNFTFWGSNSSTAFADLVYSHDTNWTPLTCSQNTLEQHVEGSDIPAAITIAVTNSTPYQYYAFTFADNYGHEALIGVRRIELQLEPYSGSRRRIVAGALQ